MMFLESDNPEQSQTNFREASKDKLKVFTGSGVAGLVVFGATPDWVKNTFRGLRQIEEYAELMNIGNFIVG